MSRMSRSDEPAFYSKTLELFYKTFDNLHFTESDIAAMLEKIEQKHGISTHKAANITSRIKIKFTEEDRKFFNELKNKKQIREFCETMNIHPNFLWDLRKKGYCTEQTYERIQKAIKKWKESHAS